MCLWKSASGPRLWGWNWGISKTTKQLSQGRSLTFPHCAGRNICSIVNFRSSPRQTGTLFFVKVNVLDEDSLNMDLEFGIRETTCRRDSGEDPATCDFQRGYYAVSLAGNTVSQKLAGQSTSLLPWPGAVPSHKESLAPAWHPAPLGGTNCIHTEFPGEGVVWLGGWGLEPVVLSDPGKLFLVASVSYLLEWVEWWFQAKWIQRGQPQRQIPEMFQILF